MTKIYTVQSSPLRHISIRVPWHDNGWNGNVCKNPKLNGACLKLKNIVLNRDDDKEESVRGESIGKLDQKDWPCCISERAAFMAPFEYIRYAEHPYSKSSPKTHGHFAPTPLRHPPYSAPAIPFQWTLNENLEPYINEYKIDVNLDREPKLPFETDWVQDRDNQKALLDCFFGHIRPEQSLCFFTLSRFPLLKNPVVL